MANTIPFLGTEVALTQGKLLVVEDYRAVCYWPQKLMIFDAKHS
jgi:hypothetical protein